VVTRQGPRSTRLLVISLVCVSLAVITLDYREGATGPLAGLGRSGLSLVAPMQRAVTSVTRPVGDFLSGLVHAPSLERRNQELQDQVRDLQSQVEKNALTKQQIDTLTGLLGLRETLDPSAVAATVVGNGVSNFDWTITIDRGTADGIALDMPVVAGSSSAPMLVGKVIQVADNASVVQLILDRRWAGAGVLGTTKASGLVVGQGDQDLTLGLPTGTQVQAPEPVYTQGYCIDNQPGEYPPGILIGEVSRVPVVSNQIEEDVDVRPAIDFATLQFVLVLKARKSC
jgi:rod shape-determining protein MreC